MVASETETEAEQCGVFSECAVHDRSSFHRGEAHIDLAPTTRRGGAVCGLVGLSLPVALAELSNWLCRGDGITEPI